MCIRDSGRALSYIVKEVEESLEKAGYTVSYNSGGATVVNSRAVGGTNVTVEKLWAGDNENLRPRQITVKLLADGQELTDRSVTLPRQDEAGKAVWRYTWEAVSYTHLISHVAPHRQHEDQQQRGQGDADAFECLFHGFASLMEQKKEQAKRKPFRAALFSIRNSFLYYCLLYTSRCV